MFKYLPAKGFNKHLVVFEEENKAAVLIREMSNETTAISLAGHLNDMLDNIAA